MRISVIIPTLNEERTLPVTLAQTLPLGFDEILVVDGGSSDGTQNITERLDVGGSRLDTDPPNAGGGTSLVTRRSSLVAVLISPPGRARQMNVGARAATGDVLLFLHADTLLPTNARTEIESALAEAGCLGGRFDVRFERDAGPGWLISRMINLRSRLTGIATGDQALFVRRSTFDALGGFADVPLMEDIDLTKRLKRQGRIAALRAQVTSSFRRWEAAGPIRTILLMWTLRFLYWIGVSPVRLKALYRDER
ncbi:MAG: glycosyltransferase [Nitrospira sp.]|nr:MAG: glycosyltransferase [Nitrospira sp.]